MTTNANGPGLAPRAVLGAQTCTVESTTKLRTGVVSVNYAVAHSERKQRACCGVSITPNTHYVFCQLDFDYAFICNRGAS